jgi:outer membrane protein OmpA-like peptidoglycan-associated protein
MSVKFCARGVALFLLLALTLSGCSRFHPPYNNFKDDHRPLKRTTTAAAAGAGTGAIIGSLAGNTAAGAIIGGAAGTALSVYRNSQKTLIKRLENEDIQYIAYGDTRTLVIPTDRYFLFNSPHLNDICYAGLNNIVRLLKQYPNTPIYVAAFTDDVGSRYHKRMLTQARAETMLTFLWANDIAAQRLHAEGYGDKHDVGDNHWIRGSAYNRRIEIQWVDNKAPTCCKQVPYLNAANS